jgi:hypothetical protein
VTKFASSLFILVFGIALAVAFVPHAGTPDWPRKRARLLWSALKVFVCYKLLTIAELAPTHSREAIVDTLLYRDFPSYVEILGFYALALLWIPFVLPLWARTPLALRLLSPPLAGVLAWWLTGFDFWGVPPLQALIVEHPDYYTWGQLSRLPLVLTGLLIGDALRRVHARSGARAGLAGALVGAGLSSLATFWFAAGSGVQEELLAIARNAGKHPPETYFMLFSVGGALVLLGLSVLGGERAARGFAPLTLIGSASLKAFVFHIVVIFVGLRWGLRIRDNIGYGDALALTLGILVGTALFIALAQALERRLRRTRSVANA